MEHIDSDQNIKKAINSLDQTPIRNIEWDKEHTFKSILDTKPSRNTSLLRFKLAVGSCTFILLFIFGYFLVEKNNLEEKQTITNFSKIHQSLEKETASTHANKEVLEENVIHTTHENQEKAVTSSKLTTLFNKNEPLTGNINNDSINKLKSILESEKVSHFNPVLETKIETTESIKPIHFLKYKPKETNEETIIVSVKKRKKKKIKIKTGPLDQDSNTEDNDNQPVIVRQKIPLNKF